jgi:hypothetical protein
MLTAMSWETVTSLPQSHASGSPYQGQAEPVVAKRIGLRALERVRLFFRSTPELPSARAARSVVLTPNHLYVERVSGTIERVRLDALKGRRVDGPLVVYGVNDGEDLALPARAGCPVIAALDARHGEAGKGALPPVVVRRHVAMALFVASLLAAPGTFWLVEYSLDEMWDRIHRGLYTAEVVLGVVAGASAILGALLVLQLAPMRIHIDTLGVRRVRGLVPWLQYLEPPETFRSVRLDVVRYRLKSGATRDAGFVVRLRRRGEEASQGDLELRQFVSEEAHGKDEQHRQANELALRVAALLDLPVDRGS